MKTIKIADLFCGAGGTSTGAVDAVDILGYTPDLTAVNHWDTAIATHTANHPEAKHLLTAIDNVNPRDHFEQGGLDLLWASPECTHHSVARGGRPINEQSRATAWCVVRWADAVQPSIILVENVPEFISWGGIGSNGRPLKQKKGKTFMAWVESLESLGYRVDWRILCAADYGDPTTRKRLFVQAVRGRRKIVWPEPTHASPATLTKQAGADMFDLRRPWVAAREIIDWKLEGQSIYERKRPLSEKTMRRIMTGLRKFGLKPFIVPQNSGRKGGDDPGAGRVASVDEPLHTVTTTSRGVGLAVPVPCEPMILSAGGPDCPARPVSEPMGTILTRDHRAIASPTLEPIGEEVWDQTCNCGHSFRGSLSASCPGCGMSQTGVTHGEPFIIGAGGPEGAAKPQPVSKPLGTVIAEDRRALIAPYLVNMKGKSNGADLNQPAPTITAGAPHLHLAEPFIVKLRGGEETHFDNSSAKSLAEPIPSLTCGNNVGLAEPFLIQTDQTGSDNGRAQPIDKPLGTVVSKQNIALIAPFLVPSFGEREGQAPRSHSINDPLPAVCATGHINLAEPFLVQVAHGNGKEKHGDNRRSRSLDDPLGAVVGSNDIALVSPELKPDNRCRSIDDPLNTVCGNRGETALCVPHLLPQHGGGALRPVTEPAPTVATKGAIGLAEPFLIKYYGTADGAQSVSDPLDTVTAKERHGLATPSICPEGIESRGRVSAGTESRPARPVVTINGEDYLLDIRFRMLQPHELAGAQGFPSDYKFTGNKTDQVKLIGNAVPRRLARALVLAAVSQRSDIAGFLTTDPD